MHGADSHFGGETAAVSGSVALAENPLSASYDFGAEHPMRAARAELALDLARSLGVMDRTSWCRISAPTAESRELALVHSSTYIAMVRSAGRVPVTILHAFGLGTNDTPIFEGIHEAASAVVGASISACRSVWSRRTTHAVSLVGGLHHAMPENASGFCVYNDVAIGIADMLAAGCCRVAYVDLDAHHGDGVETVFASDPRVLTISIHQDGRTIFPGTGHSTEVGSLAGEGFSVNVPLPPGTSDHEWLRALTAVVPVLLRTFRPEVMVAQCGCDAHVRDPLTDLQMTVDGFTVAYQLIHDLAHELCDGRLIVLGGGGYDLGSAVPRSWSQLLAVVSGEVLPSETAIPEPWREFTGHLTGASAPAVLGDRVDPVRWQPWDAGDGDPDNLVDRAIARTRRAVFPLHALDPFSDR